MLAKNVRSNINILFVDDEKQVLRALGRYARTQSWSSYFADSAKEAMELLEEIEFAVMISDMQMPGENGADFFSKARELQPHAIRVLLSGHSDVADVQDAVNRGGIHSYMSKPWDEEELDKFIGEAIQKWKAHKRKELIEKKHREQSVTIGKVALLMNKKAKEKDMEVEQALSLVRGLDAQIQLNIKELVEMLYHLITMKEGRDKGHTHFVATYAEKISSSLGMSEQSVSDVVAAAMLHRVGLLSLPGRLSSRPYYKLSDIERDQFNEYPENGALAIQKIQNLNSVANLVKHHREYIDGSGFPDGLFLGDVPEGSKIVGLLSDFYDVCHGKIEKNLSGAESALSYIKEWAGKKYDTKLVDVFESVLDLHEAMLAAPVFLTSEQLQPGMHFDQDVYSSAGALLVSRGAEVTSSIVENIQAFEREGEEYAVCELVSAAVEGKGDEV